MKKFLALVLTLCLALSLVACSSSNSSSNSSSDTSSDTSSTDSSSTDTSSDTTADTTSTYTKSSDYDASGDPSIDLIFTANALSTDWHGMAMTTFAEAVEELSGGSVTCSVYSDSTLFSSENEWDAINQGGAAGGADMAYISFPTLSTQTGLEWCAMINTAYFWSNYDHMTSVLNGEIGQEMYDMIAAESNIVPLDGFYLGSRVINTRTKEIDSQADMNGLLLRMPSSEAWLNLGRALGAEPTSLAFSELYTALQTGSIEGQDNPLPSDVNAAFYEVAPYFAITNHVVDSILPCINADTWNSLTEAQQLAVRDAIEAARDFNDTNRIAQEEECISFLEEQGCTVTYPDIDEFKEYASQWYADHPEVTADWDMDLYNEIQAAA
jgi:tripartite ATP-independent transporter DctP family solute receptor